MNGFPNAGGPALRIDRLTKRYGDFTAVDGISLDVARGDFFGFLGPNGAGKTTSINAIVGLATITSGTIEIFGHDNVRDWRAARPTMPTRAPCDCSTSHPTRSPRPWAN